MSKLANQWIELFRAGDYGEKGSFSEADLDRMVANYKPEYHEAPVVIGHPAMDAPAYGWVESVKRTGNVLMGKLKQVVPAFAEMVESGQFKKRSASFYKTPNGPALRHVGFLGAQPPVVKGLADCKFADTSEQVVVEFQESAMADETVTAVNGFKAWLEGVINGSKPAAGASFSEADVKRIATEAANAAAVEAVKPVQAKLDAATASFAERDASLATVETKARGEAAVAKLKVSGKWVPAFEKMGLSIVFAELAKGTETVEFGEGDAKKKITPLEVLVNFMEGLGKIVPVGETYTGQQAGAPTAAGMKGVNSGHAGVDANSVKLHEAALSFAETNKVDYIVALGKVVEKHPELTIAGNAAIGQV